MKIVTGKNSVGIGTFKNNTIALDIGNHPQTVVEPKKQLYSFIREGAGAQDFRAAISSQVMRAISLGLRPNENTICQVMWPEENKLSSLDNFAAVWMLSHPACIRDDIVRKIVESIWLESETNSQNVDPIATASLIKKTPENRLTYGWNPEQMKSFEEGATTIWDIFNQGYPIAATSESSTKRIIIAKGNSFVPFNPLDIVNNLRKEDQNATWVATPNVLIGQDSKLKFATVLDICELGL